MKNTEDKILFVLKNENFIAPNGLCRISAMARQAGYNVSLCEVNSQDVLKRIAEFNPKIIAYSACSGEAKHYLKLNRKIKERFPHIFSIMGGPHATFYPQVVKDDYLDAACVGEGEGAFFDFLKSQRQKTSLRNIPNIVTKDTLVDGYQLRSLIEDLDSLPLPDYELIYDNTPLGKYPLKSVITSRGCPYNCAYCFNAAWRKMYQGKGTLLRRHSVDYVVDEIRHIKGKWPLSFVKFYDDIFAYKADSWLEEFSKKYKEKINLPFFILTRADLLTEDMVKLLKAAGCRTISMSIEAGNSRIRRDILRRDMSDEQIIRAHHLCKDYGIYTFTNCIIGLPETALEHDIKSVDLAIQSKADWAEFPIFYPYPGTELGEKAIAAGLYRPDFGQMHTSYQYKSIINCFSEKEKNAQMNLALLGAVAVASPRFKNIFTRRLIFCRHNFLFTLLYYLTKMRVFRNKIYVTQTNFWTNSSIYLKSLRQEWFRHENCRG